MLAERFFKASNMDLFRVATSVPEVFTQIEAAAMCRRNRSGSRHADPNRFVIQ